MAIWPFDFKWGKKSTDITNYTWAEFLGMAATSKSGVAVNVDSALKVSTVLACARVLAEGVAQLPLKIFRTTDSPLGKMRTEATDHPAFDLLYRAPNDWMTSFELREQMMFHAVLTGNAYAYIGWGGRPSRVIELIPLVPSAVTPIRGADYSMTYRVQNNDGTTTTYSQENILHIRGPSWNGYLGLDAVQLAREAIGLAIATEQTHASLHANGAQPGGILIVKGKLDDPARERLKLAWNQFQGGVENKFKTAVVDMDSDWKPLAMNGVDSQHIETRKFQIQEICRVMRVFPLLVMDSSDTATYASSSAFLQAHWTHSLQPWVTRWEQSLAHVLLDGEPDLIIKFNANAILRGTPAERIAFYQGALGGARPESAWMTRNEVRALEDLDPIEGGDKLPEPEPVPVATKPGLKYNENHDELGRFASGSAGDFVTSRDTSSRPQFLSPTPASELEQHTLRMGYGGKVGYALDPSGDLQNVFNNGGPKGAGGKAVVDAIKYGAKTLDAYDGHLPALYAKYGFEAVSRVKFADEYAPAGWDYEKSGRPDIVFMAYRGGDRANIQTKVGTFAPYRVGQGEYYASYDSAKAASRSTVMDKHHDGGGIGGDGSNLEHRWRRFLHNELGISPGSLARDSRLLKFNPAAKYNPDQPRDEGGEGGGQWISGGGGGDGNSARVAGETDKQFAKRVIDKRPAPDVLPEDHSKYFTLPAGTRIVSLDDLVSSKTDADNVKGGDNGAKRMAAAAAGELSKREPISVEPIPGTSKFRIVDGNGTYTTVKNYGWVAMPVLVAGTKYNPDQPRDPGGEDGGQWISGGGGDGGSNRPTITNDPGDGSGQSGGASGRGSMDIRKDMSITLREDRQPTKSLDDLYKLARDGQSDFIGDMQNIATATNGGLKLPPPEGSEPGTILKPRASAERKVNNEYKGDASQLKDILRATILHSTWEETRQATADFMKLNSNSIVRIKDRIANPGSDGYRDLLVNYRTKSGLVAEVQFNTRAMLATKSGEGHALYREAQLLQMPGSSAGADTVQRVRELQAKQLAVYNAADLESGNGTWK